MPNPPQDFDGCNRECRKAGEHTLNWGLCEHAVPPEPYVSMSAVYTDPTDGYPSIGFDTYTEQQLAELIEPALRTVAVRLGPNALAMLERGETVQLSGGEYAELARTAAHAIVHRNDQPPATPALVVETQQECSRCSHITCMGGKPCGVISTERGELVAPCGCKGAEAWPATETLVCVCGSPAIRDGESWTHQPGTGGTCLYRPNARPRCPDCQMPHDLTPGGVGMRACVSILASIADRDAAQEDRRG